MRSSSYSEYARSDEAKAVQFVRQYLNRADDTKWVDILDWRDMSRIAEEYDIVPEIYGVTLFRRVECELFPKLHVPVYPKRSRFKDDYSYRAACAEATWRTATQDIQTLRGRGYHGPRYSLSGRIEYQEPPCRFVPGTPPEIMALLDNPNDYTDPLWERAMRYEAKGTSTFDESVSSM